MTVAITRTKAFAALGLPHRRLEAWKYTDLRSALKEAPPAAVGEPRSPPTPAELEAALEALAELAAHRLVFVDGVYAPGLSHAAAPAGVTFTPLAASLRNGEAEASQALLATGQREAVIALNTAFMTDGAVIDVAPGRALGRPLLLVFLRRSAEARLITTRNHITIGAGARATLIEAHLSLPGAAAGQSNTLSELRLAQDAQLAHVKVTLGGQGESHVGTGLPRLGAGASYRAFQFTADTGLVRNGTGLTFDGEGGKADVSGCFLGRGREHIDSTLLIDHAVAGCESRELFKGVLAGKARGVVQGKVIVRPGAQKTDGKQMAQALMLSEEAEFDSKPELEINADDVVCGHGSTSAEIDKDLLFYFRARGIAADAARALLIESFIGEAIDKVEEAVRPALMALARARLAQLTS
jgi:Fe-S cluster assembly protein SufD